MKFGKAFTFDSLGTRLAEECAKRPILAIVLVSLVAIGINCYPIIFCGKSYVSPTAGVPLLYDAYPTLPEMTNVVPVNAHGSDTGGTLIWGVPIGFLESRSVLEHGELPLWNRYSHAGDTLIGQAISMIGDPLHWIVILEAGSATGWDIKFVVAKLLFSIGFGLLIRRLLGSLPLALIFAALSAYCGAFYYIYNHPVFFVFSYAPWILLSALELLDQRSRLYFRWGLVWLLANFGCFNGGHVETAVVLIGGLNLAATAFSLATFRGVAAAIAVFVRLAIGTVLFLALTAPFWISFLVALQGAFSLHSEVRVTQFPFASLLGIFDDVFFRLPAHQGPFMAPAPGTSFLVFVGTTYALIRWQLLKSDPFFWVNTSALVLWGGCVFGWVPKVALAAVPFLNRIGHTHTDFSYLLVIHLTIQCAYGFKCMAMEETFRRTATGLLQTALVVGGITLLYCFGFEHGSFLWIYYAIVTVGAFTGPLLFAFLRSRSPLTLPGTMAIVFLSFLSQFRFGFYNGGDPMLMIPGPRVVLNAPSLAIETIKTNAPPFRVVGAEENLSGDYSVVYGLEDIGSCAPLSNSNTVSLLRGFPGITSILWQNELTNLVSAHALLNLLNVKYVLTRPTVGVQEGLGFRLANQSDLGIVENLEVWPRAFFSDGVIPLSSNEEFIQYLLGHGRQPFVAMTPDEIGRQPGPRQLQANAKSTVVAATNYQLRVNSTAFDIHTPSAGMVCLTEGQAKDFVATANGLPRTVLTVNRAFKGIFLESPGDYHVEFIFRPRHWKLACALFWTGMGSVLLLALAVGCAKPKRAAPKDAAATATSEISIS